ncbi:hypothetical protein DSUL_170008 [Desulfovibrionales bacterium]
MLFGVISNRNIFLKARLADSLPDWVLTFIYLLLLGGIYTVNPCLGLIQA